MVGEIGLVSLAREAHRTSRLRTDFRLLLVIIAFALLVKLLFVVIFVLQVLLSLLDSALARVFLAFLLPYDVLLKLVQWRC